MNNSALFPIPEEWEVTTLGSACKQNSGNIQTGPFGSQLHAYDYISSGIPVIMPQNISTDNISEEGLAYISEENAQRLSRYLVQEGDIIYSRRGDVERRALITRREDAWLCGTGCLRIRFDSDKIDSRYTYYYLGHPLVRKWIVQHAVGATMPNLNTAILGSLPFILPPLPEQRAIARVLGSLDDKIDLNRKMNATLEEIARTLFKSWFIDFDPVHAKAAGRAPAGMDAATAVLFPDSFEEVQGRKVPKGWKLTFLRDTATFVKGASYKSSELQESTTALVTLKSVERGGGYKEGGLKPFVGEYKQSQIINAGEIVVAHTDLTQAADVLARPALIRAHPEFSILVASLDLMIVRPKLQWLSTLFLYELLQREEFSSHAYGYSNGTTVLHLSSKALSEYRFILPSQNVVQYFTTLAEQLLQKIEQNNIQSRILASVRETLLPKLISGEIRVRDAEHFVEEQL